MGLLADILFGSSKPPEPTPEERRALAEKEKALAEEKRKKEQEIKEKKFKDSWNALENHYNNKKTLSSTALKSIKRPRHEKELEFSLTDIKGYMPISEIDLEFVNDIDAYVGKKMDFRIISMSEYTKELKLSRRVILKEARDKKLEEERKKREEQRKIEIEEEKKFEKELELVCSYRDYVEAEVLSVDDRGINVKLTEKIYGRDVECWIHISELADHFVNSPADLYKVGDKIRATAKAFTNGKQLDLSIKNYLIKEKEKRAKEVFSTIKNNDSVQGKITSIHDFGAFVDINGVEALIPRSEISRSYVNNPNDYLRVGELIDALVLDVNKDEKKITLSIKAYQLNKIQQQKNNADYINIINSKLEFEGPICIRLNDKRDRKEARRYNLDVSIKYLSRIFPKISAIKSENVLETILWSTFPDGITINAFIRNLTFEGYDGSDLSVLALRPEIIPGSYLDSLLKNGSSLIFKGKAYGKEFVVDSIYDTSNTEQLDFEAKCTITTFRDPSKIGNNNFLYDVMDTVASITKHTSNKLDEWELYLKWKRGIAERQIAGCKYYSVIYDKITKSLIFYTIFSDKNEFLRFRKHFRSPDILAYGNSFSSEKWSFVYNENNERRNTRTRGLNLGKFNGIKKHGSLNDGSIDWVKSLSNDEINEIAELFESPYFAKVSYELNDDINDEISELDLSDEEETEYINKNIMNDFHSEGFLALSSAGQFALINRFDRAIGGLRDDLSKSPNLSLWLFDSSRARIPSKEGIDKVEKWRNKDIACNDNQKSAVQKMLDAPDLCLIQGPPGTGKTTVIAEAIYQMAKRGERVLIASQSNDAVDNALDRLAESPTIRAIRLGQKNRRKNNQDEYAPHKYSEDEAIKSYYVSLANSIKTTWTDNWDKLDETIYEVDNDERNIKYFNKDLIELHKNIKDKNLEIESLENELKSEETKLQSIRLESESQELDSRQVTNLENLSINNSSEDLYFSDESLDFIFSILEPILNEFYNKGFLIIPIKLNKSTQTNRALNDTLKIAKLAIENLKNIGDAILLNSGIDEDNEVAILQRKKQDMQTAMLDALDNDDYELEEKLKKEIKEIKLQIDKQKFGMTGVDLNSSQQALLSNDIKSKIKKGDTEQIINDINTVIAQWKEVYDKLVKALKRKYRNISNDSYNKINENISIINGKLDTKRDELNKYLKEEQSKNSLFTNLSKKYKCKDDSYDSIMEGISNARSYCAHNQESQSLFRSAWEPMLKLFRDKLTSEEVLDFDSDYFKTIYINACNVVGISCTDDMRNLEDNGFDAFDTVIIDEVSKATPPELLIPLMKAKRAVLVGDHRQLPPMFDEHEKSYSEIIDDPESIPDDMKGLMTGDNFKKFQNMVTSSLFKEYFEKADDSIKHSLLVQYRMHSDIMAIINRFYDGKLISGLSADEESLNKEHGLDIRGLDGGTFINKNKHAYWIDSSSLPDGTPIYESFPGRSTSACNYLEAVSIIELLKLIATEYKKLGYSENNKKSIGVISFYFSQVRELRKRFKNERKIFDFSSLNVDINTVDRFQGKEKNIIIVSLVRNNKIAKASKHVAAFERINVAFSRAQELLIIVGANNIYKNLNVELSNMDTGKLLKNPVYKYILEDLKLKGCLRNAGQILNQANVEEVMKCYEKDLKKE